MNLGIKPFVYGLVAVFAAASSSPAAAQDDFPSRPITLIIPWAAGGSSDMTGRALAKAAAEHLGQQIVVVNRPGASTQIGISAIAHAKPDGYTIGTLSSSTYALQAQGQKLPFDVNESLSYISYIGDNTVGIAVRADSPYKTLKELLDAARSKPEEVKFGTAGPGSTPHLLIESLSDAARVKFTHVPYQGSAATMPALIGGFVDFVCEVSTWAPFVREGRVRLLAVAAPRRIDEYPSVPTLTELGYPQVRNIQAVIGPKGLPEPIRNKLEAAFRKALQGEEFQQSMRRLSMTIVDMPGAQVAELVRKETADMTTLYKRISSAAAR
ncbi:MAG: tripartite tricarboxylate transporter substrate binding protein [Burkholderiaceae bacterium]